MIERIIILTLRFILLVLLQVLVLNNIRLFGYINPFLYVLFVLLLPVEMPGGLVLLLSFLLGTAVDFFTNTPGMHGAATVFMAFVRKYLLKLMAPRDGYEPDKPPGIGNMGIVWFLTFSLILVFLHHMVLFYIEVFRFREFFTTLLRVFLSTIVTVVLVILSEYLFIKRKSTD